MAQTAPTKPTAKERQADVKATTEAAAASTTGAQTAKQQAVNVQNSRETPKMTSAAKNTAIKEKNKMQLNPNNSAGVGTTERMQKETTATSKQEAKQRVNLNTPEAQKALEKAATP